MKLRSKANNRSISLEEHSMIDVQEKGNGLNATKNLRNYKKTNLEIVSSTERTNCIHREMLMHNKVKLSKRKNSPDNEYSLFKTKCERVSDLTLNLDKTPKKQLYQEDAEHNKNTPTCTITPKSSPITVVLTPHRSKKTPRKSPKNLASPKTHTNTLSRVSKIPRKLTLRVKSSMTFNNPNTSSHMDSTPQKQQQTIAHDTFLQQDKTSKTPVLRRKKGKSSSPNLRHIPRRHSKLPKILLRPMQLKSKKSKSPKRKLTVNTSTEISVDRAKKFSSTNISNTLKESVLDLEHSLPAFNKKISLINTETLQKKMLNGTGINQKTSSLKLIAMSSNPRVMLQRLTLHGGINECQKQPKTSVPSMKFQKLQSRKNAKEILKNGISNIFIAYEMPPTHDKNINVSTEEINETEPVRTSTPDIEFKSLGTGLERRSSFNNFTIETVSKSDSKSNSKLRNETYEVLEPKTLNMKQKRRSEGLSKTCLTNNNQINEIKKFSKVRFAHSLTNRKSTSDIKKKQEDRKSIRNKRLNDDDGSMDTSKRMTANLRSNSSRIKNTTNPTTCALRHQALESKNSITRKVPNFTQIHKRMFAKSESLVDAVKRIQEKHTALTKVQLRPIANTKSSLPSLSSLPSSSLLSSSSLLNRNIYNRFGYKLRKKDASDIILRKLQPHSRNRQHERRDESRTVLKGVRTNRRFELQMKHRNIKF